MEETEDSNGRTNKKCTQKPPPLRARDAPAARNLSHRHRHRHPHQLLLQHSHQYPRYYYPALLPLPTPITLQLPPPPPSPLPLHPTFLVPRDHRLSSKAGLLRRATCKLSDAPPPLDPIVPNSPAAQVVPKRSIHKPLPPGGENGRKPQELSIARRPDSGGVEGLTIPLLANHFLVRFDPSQRIYHYNVEITPSPSREIAGMIKRKLVKENQVSLCGALPAFDGRKNLYSPVEFQNDRLDLFISLPIPTNKPGHSNAEHLRHKLFRVNIRLVSKLDGNGLGNYLNKEGDDDWTPLPQNYLQALDIVLRESPSEKCIPVGRSMYSASMGGSREIGGGAIGMRGFFQSLRPTQQGLALNVDLSVTAFHESIGVIPYLEKRLKFLRDLSKRKTRGLIEEERKEVEQALRNIRVFVCHRETIQRYRVYSLTEDSTENLWFPDRDGKNLRLVTYFKDHYNYDVQFRNLPCLQVSRSKPCYLPMELCVICEGQKFLGKLSDDQTAGILKMGCQRPRERKAIINGVVRGPVGPARGNQEGEFKIHISKEMTRLNGRILQPPKLKLGEFGHVRDIIPSRQDRQWNLLDSHVFEGTRIEKWALISFGGTSDQRSNIPRFIAQLSQRCEQLGIRLSKNGLVPPQFEPGRVLNDVQLLETKLKNIQRAASNKLGLLLCVMERKHGGYADLKRIAETGIGVVTQCCLYSNLAKSSSQFLANLALKINAKVGGCTTALYDSLPSQIPRLLRSDKPVMFMGADVTHPHPLDDSSPSVAAVVGSVNWPSANKYASRMRSQAHRQEIIEGLREMVVELLDDFRRELNKLPERIIFFRDGVSETQFRKVLEVELRAIRDACSAFSYEPGVTFIVVQKRHHTRLFLDEAMDQSLIESHSHASGDENIPPGTVVDTVITHPKEFDFYLCSHWGVKGTSRPTHYHVLWDENGFTSDELQKLVYNLCYTFVRCTKPVSLVPPAYYAHLAAYRGRLYLERMEPPPATTAAGQNSSGHHQISRAAPAKTTPLPKLSENIKNLMFYC